MIVPAAARELAYAPTPAQSEPLPEDEQPARTPTSISLLFVQNAGFARLSWEGSEAMGFQGQLILGNVLPTTIW